MAEKELSSQSNVRKELGSVSSLEKANSFGKNKNKVNHRIMKRR